MQHLRDFGTNFISNITNKNKIPPDDLLVSCRKQLTDLKDEILLVKQQFAQYSHQVVEASEASVTLSKSVKEFYSKANHPGRTESVKFRIYSYNLSLNFIYPNLRKYIYYGYYMNVMNI